MKSTFAKGHEKQGGRKAGTPNKVTGTIRDFIKEMINENREQIRADLAQLEPKDRLLFIERLLAYCVPKYKDEMKENNTFKLFDDE